MSVYYEVFEHLVIQDTQKHSYEQSRTVARLALLGAWILNNQGSVGKLQVIADGKKYAFSGNKMTEAYHDALNAAADAKQLEICWDYGYSCSALDPEVGPFEMVQDLDELVKDDPEALSGLFYCAYHNADCGEGAGITVAYGEKNGVLHTGAVPFVPVESIPDGEWYTPQTAVVCDLDDITGMDMAQIQEVCREMSQFSQADSMDISENDFSFALNNLRIRNDMQLKTFFGLYARLTALTNGACGLIGELADISVPDVRMICFDVNAQGEYTLQMASA